MKCPVCSSEIPEGSRFCTECGTAAPVTVPPYEPPKEETAPEKKKSYKLILILAAIAAAIVVAAIAVALILAGKGGGKKTVSGGYSPDALSYVGGYVVSRAGKVCEIEDGSIAGRSLDGSVMLIYSSSDEELFAVTKAGANRISRKELLSSALSADGSKAVWIEDDGKLFSYDVKSGKTTLLAELDSKKDPSAVVSPDGKTVLCSDGGDLYLISSGKPTELGESGIPIGVSNGGKYVYFVKQAKGGWRLSVMSDGTVRKLADSDSRYTIGFNASLDEIVYIDNASGKIYISVRGGEPEKLTDYSANTAEGEPAVSVSVEDGANVVAICGRSTFVGMVYRAGNSMRVVTSSLDTEKLAGKISLFDFANACRTAAWINESGELWYIADPTAKKAAPVLLAEDVEDPYYLVIAADGSLIYYLNDDHELIAVTPKGEQTRVGDDVDTWSYFDYATGDLYYISGGDTYKVAGTEKAVRVKTPEDFAHIMADGGNIIFYDSDYDAYILTSDGNFMEID